MVHLVPCMGPSKNSFGLVEGLLFGGERIYLGLGMGQTVPWRPALPRCSETQGVVNSCLPPGTHLLSLLLTVEDTLAVQLEALGAVVHPLKDRRWRLANHRDTVSLFPLPTLQALDLQELPGETQTPDWPAEPEMLHLGCTKPPTDVRSRLKASLLEHHRGPHV